MCRTLNRQKHQAKLQQNESGQANESEENKLQESLDKVSDIIWTPALERSEAQIDTLVEFVEYSKVFRELSHEALKSVCSTAMRREAVSEEERLFVQGALPKAFYVLVSGTMTLSEMKENGQDDQTVLVPGDVFGKEYALRWPMLCTNTALAQEQSVLIKLDCEEYEAAIEQFKNRRQKEYMNFLQQVDFISEWPLPKVEQIASRVQNQICDDRQMVVKTGDVIEGIHFVWSGSLRLVRYFDHSLHPLHAAEADAGQLEAAGSDASSALANESQIALLKTGEYVGEEPCVRTEQVGLSSVCVSLCVSECQ